MNDYLIQLLTEHGFTKNQSLVYLSVLKLVSAPASTIAKNINIDRSNCYTLLHDLIGLGVIFSVVKKGVTHFYALPPDNLGLKLQNRVNNFLDHIGDFEKIIPKEIKKPSIYYIQGDLSVKEFLFQNLSKWQISMSKYDNTWRGFQDDRFISSHREWLEKSRFTKLENEEIKLLSNKGDNEKSISGVENRYIKSTNIQFDATTWICGDFIVSLVIDNKSIYAYEIFDPVLSSNLREVFKLLWLYAE